VRVLLIAQEPPLDCSQVVTGNALRADQLTRALQGAGHELTQVWLSKDTRRRARQYRNRDELRSLVLEFAPQVLLVSYWQLLELLPLENDIPVVLDFVAPRPLEAMFQYPATVSREIRQLRLALARADLVLVGHDWQEPLLLLPLIEAGLDLRENVPVAVVPLAGAVVSGSRKQPARDGWKLVSGGVEWPWRNARAYWDAIRGMQSEQLQLVLFGGDYRLHATDGQAEHPGLDVRPLQSYDAFSAFLGSEAHIGLELAEPNVERRFSQSFRSLDFLRHGLPLICNRYLPIARAVEAYGAGWLVERPEELPPLLRDIMARPEQWRDKSQNALRLATEKLDPHTAALPLLDWMAQPRKATRLPGRLDVEPAVLGVPPWRERISRMAGLTRWVVLRRLFGGGAAGGIVIVTRGDLFPADHGAAVKIVETARGLASHGRAVALVTDDRRYWWQVRDGGLERHRVPWFIRVLAKPAPLVKLLHYSKDIPQANGFLYLPLTDGSFFWRTLYVGRRIGASVIQAEFPAYAHPALQARRVLDTRTVLVQHNVEYARLRVQVAELSDEQYRRYQAIEIDLCNQCDAVICVSDNDAQRLAEDGVDRARLHVIPHGVNLAQFEQPPAAARHQFDIPDAATLLVFHGTFAYPPNAEALAVLARELLPRLDTLGLECHVLAVGRQPPANSPHPRIHLTGSAESVAPWLRAADIAVVPLLEGGGTRMKILDCFAAALPVVSTSKGIEGIPVQNGQDALVMDDWDEMAEAIAALARDPDRARKLGARGRALADELDWHVIARRYLDLYRRL
jgi:glycosyltransferase involved in cell wall biosynthesis